MPSADSVQWHGSAQSSVMSLDTRMPHLLLFYHLKNSHLLLMELLLKCHY